MDMITRDFTRLLERAGKMQYLPFAVFSSARNLLNPDLENVEAPKFITDFMKCK